MVSNHKLIEHNLDNGLKILFQSYPGASSATFMTWYKVGSRNESPGKTGLSHYLEHMSFKNTEFFKKGQIVAEITRNGGIFNAYTSRDFTAYFETFATSKLELAMLIEAERMHKLVIDEDDREKEAGVILSELERSLDNPYNMLETGLREKAYIHHPYRNPVIGWENDIEGTTVDDLRDYYNRFYAPNNATIVVVGNFDQKKTLELIKRHFASISPKVIDVNIQKENPQRKLRRTSVRKAGSCEIVKFGFHIPPADNPDIFPLIVLGEIMNLGISSRLYQSLVETQVAVDINTNVEVAKDPGLFTILATLFPKVGHEEAEKRILEEICAINGGKAPLDEELEKTKRRIRSSFEFNRDGTFKLAYLLGYYATVDSHKFIDNYVENIEKVTIDDVKYAAEKYLDPDNSTVGYFIPSNVETKKLVPTYDYTPHETIHHIYKTPPIIIDEKITSAPIKFSKRTFNNGIRALVTENKTSDTVQLFGTIGAGNLYNSMVNPVLPVMCAGMLNRGSKGKSKIEIAIEVETRGASVGISNVGEAVNFSLSSTSKDFPYIFGILAEILRQPVFPEDEYEKYQKFAIAGVRQKKDSPGYMASMAFSQMLYPRGHVLYTYSLRAQEKQVSSVTLDDVKSFYNDFYSPDSIIFGISGNISSEETYSLIDKYFGDWQPKQVSEPEIMNVRLQRKYKEKTIYVPDRTEAEVIFGHFGKLTRKDKDFQKATVMNFILGGGGALSSRVGKRIREDLGLVYSISSSFNAMMIPGSWSVRFGVDHNYADLAIRALIEEIIKFKEEGVYDNELDLAKAYLIGSYPLRFTSNGGIAKSLLINEFYGLGDKYLDEYIDIVSSITKEDVNKAARKYLHPEVASVVKAGSFDKKSLSDRD